MFEDHEQPNGEIPDQDTSIEKRDEEGQDREEPGENHDKPDFVDGSGDHDENLDVDQDQEGSEQEQKQPSLVFVVIDEGGAIVVDPTLAEELHERSYFGTMREDGRVYLFPEEVFVLAERRRLLVAKEASLDEANTMLPEILERWEVGGREAFDGDPRFMTLDDLYRHFTRTVPDFWEKYIVYRDLKTRGYIVRRGIENVSHFRVFKRGANRSRDSAKYIYFGVFEGTPLPLVRLHDISTYARSNRQELILATVDRLSDISYYAVKKQEL